MMATEPKIKARWDIQVSPAKPNAVSAAAFARLIHPEIYEARKDTQEALAAAIALLSRPQSSPDTEKDLKRMRDLEAELSLLHSKYQ